MKNLLLGLLSITMCFGGAVKSQKLSLAEINLSRSSTSYSSVNLSEQELLKLTPGSKILDKDYSGFDQYTSQKISLVGMAGDLSFKINGSEESRFERYLDVGTYYNFFYNLGIGYGQGNLTVLDSFDGQRGLGVVTLDSVYSHNVRSYYGGEMVGLSLGHHWRTKPSRFTFQFGISSRFGVLLNTETTVRSDSRYGYKYDLPNAGGYSMTMENIENDEEVYKGKNAFDVGMGVPISIAFQLSKNQRTLKLIRLFAETELGYGFTMHPELTTFYQSRFRNSLGIRLGLE